MILVYKSVVVTSFLYGCEAWVLYRKHVQLLEPLHQRSLRSIMGIKWQDYVTNNEVLERANAPSVEAMLLTRQFRWAGHLSRMEDTRLPKAVFYGELCQGKRDRGAPRKRFKDQLKRQLRYAGISEKNWESIASERDSWRTVTRRGTHASEEARREAAEDKRRRRKASAAQSPPTQGYPCPKCARVSRSLIGLRNHERACRRLSSH